jgi:nicotinamidase-related amidase
MPTSTTFPRRRTALLLVDVINPFDFPGGEAFARRALRTARQIRRLSARARWRSVPVIYVNDNLGRWRSDIGDIIAGCRRPGVPGAAVVDLLTPEPEDFVILKSTLSGFYQTPLEAMLRLGRVETVVVGGFAADNCVFFTAADAYMRDYRVVVPSDCVGSESAAAHRTALETMRRLFGAKTPVSARVRLLP